MDDGLSTLQSCMETLREHEIILEQTVDGVTTTIALPTTLDSELNEPMAARMHLVNYLAIHMIPFARSTNVTAPPASYSMDALARMYRKPTIPNKVPSTLLHRGQGSRRGSYGSEFFNGEALDNDVTPTT